MSEGKPQRKAQEQLHWLQRLEAILDAGKEGIGPARLRQRDVEHADFGLLRLAHAAAKRCRKKLMAEADPEIGHAAIENGFADGAFLRHEPGIALLLPDIHGPAHDPELVISLEGRNGLAFVEFDGIPGNAIFRQEIAEDCRMLDGNVLKDENAHGRQTDTVAARGSSDSQRPPAFSWCRGLGF